MKLDIMNKDRDVKVTVICVIYNQEKYLPKCLDGLAEQKTNFPFEVVLHDDASTDRSVEIINRYCERYPEIFVPILQKTNQYSRRIPFFKRLLDEVKGEYIALCEGDDYWCDPYKLQKQYDYMNTHPECSMCVHNTIVHDLNGVDPDRTFMNEKNIGESGYLNEKQIFNYWIVHYSSYFIRNNYDILPNQWSLFFWARDYVMLTVAYAHGKIGVLSDVMSVYNSNNQEGLTAKNTRSSDSMKKRYDRAIFLKEYLIHYPNISNEAKFAIDRRVNAIEEDRAVSDFCERLQKTGESSEKTDIDKFEWLIKALNDEKLLNYCTNPSMGLETINIENRIFRAVDDYLTSLHSLGDAIHFSFVSWISTIYESDTPSKEYLLAIAAAPDNEVGWGIKLNGDPEERMALVFKYANEERLTENQKNELNLHRNAAIKLVDKSDLRGALIEVNKALRLSPLNKDLICYKAFILLCLRDKIGCLNEIGMYYLFYEPDENISMIYGKAQML